MTNGKLALLRLAAREFEGISASAEMFLSHGINHEDADGQVWALLKKMEKIQMRADKIRAKLDSQLEKYGEIAVQEIY
ncbi:hypothetical protein UFOVP1336_4 [uncultured Caudovirales phage]|uniref:Uncharacterized protein n=1 Tax=uncultured Caudovirales phage TaxID=2100421 RepID=A0A6J5S242_9CAUD|nr:hypothetical protein UFOVP1336_4 [uncultured Caudovirales phage]